MPRHSHPRPAAFPNSYTETWYINWDAIPQSAQGVVSRILTIRRSKRILRQELRLNRNSGQVTHSIRISSRRGIPLQFNTRHRVSLHTKPRDSFCLFPINSLFFLQSLRKPISNSRYSRGLSEPPSTIVCSAWLAHSIPRTSQ